MNLIINGVIPLLSLGFLNTSVYMKLRKMSAESDAQVVQQQYVQLREVMLAKVSCLIVVGKLLFQQFLSITKVTGNLSKYQLLVFLTCHTVKWIPNIYELQQKEVGTVSYKHKG